MNNVILGYHNEATFLLLIKCMGTYSTNSQPCLPGIQYNNLFVAFEALVQRARKICSFTGHF